MKEITITIRPNGKLSIQAAGIGVSYENMNKAKEILRRALDALEKGPVQVYLNELISKSNGKKH